MLGAGTGTRGSNRTAPRVGLGFQGRWRAHGADAEVVRGDGGGAVSVVRLACRRARAKHGAGAVRVA